jgi:hypothetical protein
VVSPDFNLPIFVIVQFHDKSTEFGNLKYMIVLFLLFAILSGLLFGSGSSGSGASKNLLSLSFEAKFFATQN